MKKMRFLSGFLFLVITFNFSPPAYCAEEDKLSALSKQVLEAESDAQLYAGFAGLQEIYFKDNKYAEFADYLKSLSQQKSALAPFADYYTALSRDQQLKYWEEKQNWDEYFAQGNAYRDEITAGLQKAIDSTGAKDALNIYARAFYWRFHRDLQDNLYEQALADLMSAVSEYSRDGSADAAPIKAAADQLAVYAEKGKAKELYKIYAGKILASDIKDEELKNIAENFYKEGNLDLAENFYDAYIGRLIKAGSKKEKPLAALIEIARLFAYKDDGTQDPYYAEKAFAEVETLGGKQAFDEELAYLRAFNLEKAQEYRKAAGLYAELSGRFPQGTRADEADYKAAIIYTYILRDAAAGRPYFEKLAAKEALSPQAASSLYQLGLLAQWGGDALKAKEYYNKTIEKAKDNFSQTANLAKERIKEIDEIKPLDYNLRTFLDLSLKEENAQFDMARIDLKAAPSVIKKGESIGVSASPFLAESGCMQVETQFLWAGDLGNALPNPSEGNFNVSYSEPGTKVICLVVVSPSGTLDRSLSLIDVY